MKEFKYIITDPLGLHARLAGALVKKTTEYDCKVTVSMDDKEVDASRIMGVMSLGAKVGMEITVKCEGEDEKQAVTELETFFKENL